MASKKDQSEAPSAEATAEGVDLFAAEPWDGELAVGDMIYPVVEGRARIAADHVEAATQAGFSPQPAQGHAIDDGVIVPSEHNAGGRTTESLGGAAVVPVPADTEAENVPAELEETPAEEPSAPAELTAADFAAKA